jgi:hypothetical protein
VLRDIKFKIVAASKSYPFKMRVLSASLTCVLTLLVTVKNWHFDTLNRQFEPWKTIAICAFTVAWLFEPKKRWNMFFLGVGIGDVLLYLLR